jgi:PAS domain S-box-containing protein
VVHGATPSNPQSAEAGEQHQSGHRSHASEEQFHTLVDSITDYAIFRLDAAGRVTTWNRGAERIKGYKANEIVGKSFALFYTAEDRAAGKPERILETVRREGRVEDEDWRVRKDGSRFWANVVITALRNEQGEVDGFAKVTRDLTEGRAAEEQLRQSEERFHRLIDAVTDYAIFMLDSSGHVATWNPGAKKAKGYDADEIVGRHFSVFYTVEDRESGKPDRVLETVRRDGRFEEEGWRVRKNGSRFWANIVITALRNERGDIVGFAKVTKDLTARRAAEENERALARERLARSMAEEERLRLLHLFQQVPAVVNFFRGPDLVCEILHPKALEAMGGRPVLGRPILEAMPEMSGQPYYERLRRVYDTGQTFSENEVLGRHEVNGRRVESYWNIACLPVRGPVTGAIEGVLTFELDVSYNVLARRDLERVNRENVSAREELETLNRAKDEFVATMSHELRTPLNAIYGWLAILRRSPTDQARIHRGLEVIDRNAQSLARLVNDLLDVSRIIGGKLQLRLKKADLAQAIRNATDVVRPAADAKEVRLSADIDPDIGTALVDPERLHQVLWNLLVNAVRFTPRGGRVVVSADRTASGIVIMVRDTGAGIAPEHLPHVFTRFWQADSSTTRAHGGLGLGLAIVRHLVESHGGSVEAASGGLGLGTTFTIRLPIHAVHRTADESGAGGSADPDVQKEDAPASGTSLGQVRVLVVDDDRDSLEILRMVLSEAGAKVTTAASTREALALLAVESFDVLVSDIGMPEMDGYALIRNVRSLRSPLELPAIALTAYARSEDEERVRRFGYQQHLSKPVDDRRLLQVIRDLIAAPPHAGETNGEAKKSDVGLE